MGVIELLRYHPSRANLVPRLLVVPLFLAGKVLSFVAPTAA